MNAQAELALGTICRVKLYEAGTPELYGRLFTRLAEIEALMSVNLPDSELSRINAAAGTAPVQVSPDLLAVLERALYFAGASGGGFDPTVGPLVKLWDIGSRSQDSTPEPPAEAASGITPLPSPGEITAALALVNWRNLILNRHAGTAFLTRPGMSLDLGAIAKGYAADELVRILDKEGVSGAVIDLGGNVYAHGTNPAGKRTPWRIGIQNPLDKRGAYVGIAELSDGSVVTSGVYERFFMSGGKRYHHILDTRTGYPVENGLLSVTISDASSMDADALSTAAFALGYEKGKALAEKEGAGALFIFEDGSIRGGGELLEAFTLSDRSFRMEQ